MVTPPTEGGDVDWVCCADCGDIGWGYPFCPSCGGHNLLPVVDDDGHHPTEVET